MGYRYETHLHTREVSACGRTPAADYIRFYQERGYSGIIFTDHFYHGNCGIDRSLPWEEWVRGYCRGYELAKEAGDAAGFPVYFGIEENFDGDEYLIYGITKEWLIAHPEILKCSRREYYELLHAEGALVVQAHPYRERGYLSRILLNPDYVDAVEILNLGNAPYMDALAEEYALRHGLPVTAGSDMHYALPGCAAGGIEAKEPIASIEDYVRLIKSGTGYQLIGKEERDREARLARPWKTSLPVYQYQNMGNDEKWLFLSNENS